MPYHQDVHETAMAEGWAGLGWQSDLFDEPVCDRACDDREAIEQGGYDCDCTPIDTLMSDYDLGLKVGHVMEYGDEEWDR